MRRVYYAYAISLALNPALLHGVALSLCFGILFKYVYVRAIISNFFATPVGEVPNYLWLSVTGAEVTVLALIGIITFVLLSFGVTWRHRRFSVVRTASFS